MRNSRTLIAAATVIMTVIGGLTVTSRNDQADAAVVWNEEFNGAAGTGVDSSKWNFDTGGSGWGNNELQYYNSGTANVAMDGQGHLIITARKGSGGRTCWNGTCQFTSGRILTRGKFTQQYGHIEARIQVPNGSGLWPAFWMLGATGGTWPNNGEIDIMEIVGRDPNRLFGTLHGPGYSGGNGYGGTRTATTPFWQNYHIFSIDWSPNLIIWRVDGSEYFRATPTSLKNAKGQDKTWVYNKGFFIILNLAVGGNFGQGNPGALPAVNQLKIDYVHVSTTS
jgi:beta-glucanase (GH16 family)